MRSNSTGRWAVLGAIPHLSTLLDISNEAEAKRGPPAPDAAKEETPGRLGGWGQDLHP